MSKKLAVGISVLLFVILVALVICEQKYPTGGMDMIQQLMGR